MAGNGCLLGGAAGQGGEWLPPSFPPQGQDPRSSPPSGQGLRGNVHSPGPASPTIQLAASPHPQTLNREAFCQGGFHGCRQAETRPVEPPRCCFKRELNFF